MGGSVRFLSEEVVALAGENVSAGLYTIAVESPEYNKRDAAM